MLLTYNEEKVIDQARVINFHKTNQWHTHTHTRQSTLSAHTIQQLNSNTTWTYLIRFSCKNLRLFNGYRETNN